MRAGNYELLDEIGRGGMGVVRRARSPDGRLVAIKLLGRAIPKEGRERFERERRLLASFRLEDGFVPLLDMGEDEGQLYFVMPLLEGGTLRTRLREGPLGVHQAIALAEALATALARAHERGVVHRDLKPENVIFDASGRALVADLGLAKHFSSEVPGASHSVQLSRTGQLLGTVGYMAPEQARDARSAGPAADVFSLGAILYECLAGWPAFEGRTLVEVLAKVDTELPSPLANARPETPVWLAAVAERALARDPRARQGDAAVLLQALRARSAARRGWRPERRHVLASGVLVLALAGLGLGLVVDPSGPRAPSSARPTSPRRATPELAPRTPATKRRLQWRLSAGDTFKSRVEVASKIGGTESSATLVLSCQVASTAPDAAMLVATIDALVLHYATDDERLRQFGQGPGGDPDMFKPFEYDSKDASGENPFNAAVGQSFETLVDPRSGEVMAVSGVAAIRSGIQARMTEQSEGARSMRFAMLAAIRDDDEMRSELETLLHVAPSAGDPDPSTWSVEHEPLAAVRGRRANVLLAFNVVEPSTGDGVRLEWKGSATEADGGLHTIEGQAQFGPARLKQAHVVEVIEMGARGTMRGTYDWTELAR